MNERKKSLFAFYAAFFAQITEKCSFWKARRYLERGEYKMWKTCWIFRDFPQLSSLQRPFSTKTFPHFQHADLWKTHSKLKKFYSKGREFIVCEPFNRGFAKPEFQARILPTFEKRE